MTERNNGGGPAFPQPINPSEQVRGMTLRDYFAAQALNGICANPANTGCRDINAYTQCAFKMADSMLKERK